VWQPKQTQIMAARVVINLTGTKEKKNKDTLCGGLSIDKYL